MLITDSYLGNRFSGPQIAADAYDDFLKKKGGAARPAGAAPTKRQQKKAVKAQKKELRKQGLAPKKGPFGKRKAAATGINSPAAKKTGLFGIKQKLNPVLAKLKKPAPAPAADPPDEAPEANADMNEAEAPLPDSQSEALAEGASNDLGEISDKTPAAETPAPSDAEAPSEPLPEPGTEEEQFYSYELEEWPRGRRRRTAAFDSFDEPKDAEKKPAEKKKSGISIGAVFGLLGAVAAGAIAMYVVMSAGEKTGEPELKLTRTY